MLFLRSKRIKLYRYALRIVSSSYILVGIVSSTQATGQQLHPRRGHLVHFQIAMCTMQGLMTAGVALENEQYSKQQAAAVFADKTRRISLFLRVNLTHCCTAIAQGSILHIPGVLAAYRCSVLYSRYSRYSRYGRLQYILLVFTSSVSGLDTENTWYCLYVLVRYCSYCEYAQYFGVLYCRYFPYSKALFVPGSEYGYNCRYSQ